MDAYVHDITNSPESPNCTRKLVQFLLLICSYDCNCSGLGNCPRLHSRVLCDICSSMVSRNIHNDSHLITIDYTPTGYVLVLCCHTLTTLEAITSMAQCCLVLSIAILWRGAFEQVNLDHACKRMANCCCTQEDIPETFWC